MGIEYPDNTTGESEGNSGYTLIIVIPVNRGYADTEADRTVNLPTAVWKSPDSFRPMLARLLACCFMYVA